MNSRFIGEDFSILPQPFLDLMTDNPFTGDLYIHSIGRVSDSSYHSVSSLHGENYYTFLFCSKGNGNIRLNGVEFSLGSNQYIIIPNHIPFHYNSSKTDPWNISWIRFIGTKAVFYSREMSKVQTLPSIHSLREKQSGLFESMFSNLIADFTLEKLNYTNSLLMHYLSSFLYCDLYSDTIQNPHYIVGIVNRVTHYMNENIERNLTIRELAEYAGYSDSYFYRKFTKETGYPPIDYFIRMKINKAAVYLIKTRMTAVQIAGKLGFSNPDYFSRTFKKVVGITVTEFRKQGFRL